MSRSLAKSRKATAMKSLKEKWLSMVQSVEEKGENGIGGSSTITAATHSIAWSVCISVSYTVTHKIVPMFCTF